MSLTNKESTLFNQVSRSLTFLMIIAKILGYRMMNFHNNQSNGQNNFLQTCLYRLTEAYFTPTF